MDSVTVRVLGSYDMVIDKGEVKVCRVVVLVVRAVRWITSPVRDSPGGVPAEERKEALSSLRAWKVVVALVVVE